MHELGDRIRKLRLDKGLTLQQVGEYFHIHRSSVSDWENGRTYPDARRLKELADLLNTSVEFILTGKVDAHWPFTEVDRRRVANLSHSELHELSIAMSAALAMIEARGHHSTFPSRKTGTTGSGSR